MVVEVAGDERDVDVAGLADGLAVVHGLEHGEAAGVLLDLAGEGVEIAGALVAGEGLPGGKGGAGGFDGAVDVVGGSGGDLGEEFAGCGIAGLEGRVGFGPLAVDVVAEGALVRVEPFVDFARVFGSWTVFHRLKLLKDAGCHFLPLLAPTPCFLRKVFRAGELGLDFGFRSRQILLIQ